MLCFTTCFNEDFLEGAKATIRSIRRFYSPRDARIIVFAEKQIWGLEQFCRLLHVELHYFCDIQAWAIPLIYSKREYVENVRHFYHQDFQPHPSLPHHRDRKVLRFDTIHHLYPLNVKAYCTGYCLTVANCEYVVHIDSDAFLLSKVDDLLDEMDPNMVVGFDDGTDELANLEILYQVRKPKDFDSKKYAFNGGVVFYSNGEGVKKLMLDFMHYIESCYHYTSSGTFADQGVLRALVAKHHILGNLRFELREATNWNPTWNRADNLQFCAEQGEWLNLANRKKQYIWHGAGGEKLWSGKYKSESVNAAWKYVGGEYHPMKWSDVRGSLVRENCEELCALIADNFPNQENIEILEIGTQYGRTSIAMHILLARVGKIAVIDTIDIFGPSPDYPVEFAREEEALRNIRLFGLQCLIRCHKVAPNENLIDRFQAVRFDVVFIDGNHQFKEVLADCVVAKATESRAF